MSLYEQGGQHEQALICRGDSQSLHDDGGREDQRVDDAGAIHADRLGDGLLLLALGLVGRVCRRRVSLGSSGSSPNLGLPAMYCPKSEARTSLSEPSRPASTYCTCSWCSVAAYCSFSSTSVLDMVGKAGPAGLEARSGLTKRNKGPASRSAGHI